MSGTATSTNGSVNGHAAYASFDDLAGGLPERDHTLSDGRLVRLRKLSRAGQIAVNRASTGESPDPLAAERIWLYYGLARPAFGSPDAVAALQERTDPAILDELLRAVMAYAGIGEEVLERAEATFQERQRDALRVPSGAGAPDAGGGTEAAHVG